MDLETMFKDNSDAFIEIIIGLSKKEIPYEYQKELYGRITNFSIRDKFIEMQGFSIISYNWVEPLAEWIGHRSVLEVMSGCGSLSYALHTRGVKIKATDNYTWGNRRMYDAWVNGGTWVDVENIDCVDAVRKYGSEFELILMSWPYMDDNAYKVLLEMRKVNPNAMMIVIGEGMGGCTANDNFFAEIEYVEDEQFYEINKTYPRWFGIHDDLALVK